MPDYPDSAMDPVTTQRIRLELEALFESDRRLLASLAALREEVRQKSGIEVKQSEEQPRSWLDSDKIQPRAARVSKILKISACLIILLSTAFTFLRLAMAKPLVPPAGSPIAAPAAGAEANE